MQAQCHRHRHCHRHWYRHWYRYESNGEAGSKDSGEAKLTLLCMMMMMIAAVAVVYSRHIVAAYLEAGRCSGVKIVVV